MKNTWQNKSDQLLWNVYAMQLYKNESTQQKWNICWKLEIFNLLLSIQT